MMCHEIDKNLQIMRNLKDIKHHIIAQVKHAIISFEFRNNENTTS